jgi:hypothetical protein
MLTEVLILVATHFDELAAVHCLCHMRAEGLPTRLVGLSSGLQTGLCGLKIRPDTYLTDLISSTITNSNRLLILCGGQACLDRLLTDPRVHQLIGSTLQSSGAVATLSSRVELSTVEQILNTARPHHLNGSNRLFFQQGVGTADFIAQLVDALAT